MIDRTYVINLARREDKRTNMQKEFDKLKLNGTDINPVFFDAIDGNNKEILSKYNFCIPNWFDPNSGKAMTNGEVGCALSHYLIWKDIVDSVENHILNENCYVLILEDDVIFLDNFMDKLKKYIDEANLDYDMLYLHRKPLNLEAETKISPHINNIRKSYWACAYILTFNGAKKLVNTNFLENLLPVDEFLPIMYGCNVFGFEKIFKKYEKLNCYAVCPSLLKLRGNAFNESETYHSEPYLTNNNFKFSNDNEFTFLYIGPTHGDSYQRFLYYCKLYAIPCIMIQNNDNKQTDTGLLINEFKTWTEQKLEKTLIVLLTVNPFDYCNIIPISSPTEIIDKFMAMANNQVAIVTTNAEASNRTILCSWAKNIKKMNDDFSPESFGKMNTVLSIKIISSLSETSGNVNIIRDNKCDFFQCVSQDIAFNHKSSRIINTKTNSTPCILFSNDNNSTIILNRCENYTGNNWNEYYGYRMLNTSVGMPTIYLSINVANNRNVLNIIDNLDYPKELLTVKINSVDKGNNSSNGSNSSNINYVNENTMHEIDVKKFLEGNCEYYLFIDHNCVLENPKVLKNLLAMNKDVIAPLVRKGDEAWTNFWGDLDEKGYYRRSFDYFDIINNERQGCWNVPYITGVYLIKRTVLEKLPTLFTDNDEMDLDMRMCYNFRSNNIFMYSSNMDKHGYIKDEETHKISTGEVSLYDLFDRRNEWEKKYLHPEYFNSKHCVHNLRCTELCNDIFSFPLFSETFCKELIQLSESYGKWSKGKNEHNDPRLGTGYYENVPTVDVQLFELKMDKHWHEIVFSYIVPMTKHLYNNYKTKDINLAFVVKYDYRDQNSLSPHHDSSTYTVNIALNQGNGIEYDGGGCRFIRQNYVLKNQEPGMCCIHAGRLTAYHEGLPVTAGRRYILVSFIN